MIWVTEKQVKCDTLIQGNICEKARAIYGDFLNQIPRTSTDKASKTRLKSVETGLTILGKGPAFTPLAGMVQKVQM